jgi:hypothetical protein
MPLWVAQLCDSLTTHWTAATPLDYARLCVLIVVLGWILSRHPTTR